MKKWLAGLACVGMFTAAAIGQEPAVWLNEICYDPVGTDLGGTEWLEVAGPSGIDLSSYIVVLYNGVGGVPYNTTALSGAIDDEGCGFGAVELVYATGNSLQNGAPDGIALANVSGGSTTLVQFLSYEGAFTGVGGPADGVLSVNIGIQSGTTTNTLQLGGMATNYSGYAWETNTASKGSLNVNQSITGCTPVVPTNVYFFATGALVNEDQGTFDVTLYKTLPEGEVSGEIVLQGTATEGAGADYTVNTTNFTMSGATTTATVTVTINDDADQEMDETVVLALANIVGAGTTLPNVFTLTINPSDIPTHAITITPPTNGTVTTTPVDVAEEGAQVTITATPDTGYAVDTVTVLDASLNPVGGVGRRSELHLHDADLGCDGDRDVPDDRHQREPHHFAVLRRCQLRQVDRDLQSRRRGHRFGWRRLPAGAVQQRCPRSMENQWYAHVDGAAERNHFGRRNIFGQASVGLVAKLCCCQPDRQLGVQR
ncbi:MAG TPA: hypothetical protein DCM68_06595 [Verrucomicrobia bacterium]|nr:hypothetical protein [Verrucomicrobiota bacterium]